MAYLQSDSVSGIDFLLLWARCVLLILSFVILWGLFSSLVREAN